MERKPVNMTILCEILLKRGDIEFSKLYKKIVELEPDYSDNGDCRMLSYSMGANATLSRLVGF